MMTAQGVSQPIEPVVFLHIGKTAGLSLRAILDRRFQPSQICPVDQGEKLKDLPGEQLKTYLLFRGHYSFLDITELPFLNVAMLTMLRNPVDRALSAYQHILRSPGHSLHEQVKDLSLEEFLQDEELSYDEMFNLCTRLLAGDPDLELAKQRLGEDFAFVGITERFQESMLLLSYVMDWEPIVEFEWRNVTPNKLSREDLAPETLETIRLMNALDLELYRFACDLFDARYEEMVRELLQERRAKVAASRDANAQELQRLKSTLEELQSTRSWRVLKRWWRLKTRLFPEGSGRLVVYDSLAGFLGRVMSTGRRIVDAGSTAESGKEGEATQS